MNAFHGQVAVVTGAGSGIGRALARALATQGASLALVDRRIETLDAVRADLPAARSYPADLTSDSDLRELAAAVEREFGRVDILIHSAGAIRLGSTADATPEQFDELYRTNCRAPHALTQLLLPTLRRCRGQVVFINSSAGLTGRANVGQYAATKHALRALADSLRDEVNRDGVRVLSVYCGRTATPMQQELHDRAGHPYRPERLMQPEDVAQMVSAALALPRMAEVTDIQIRPMQPPGEPGRAS